MDPVDHSPHAAARRSSSWGERRDAATTAGGEQLQRRTACGRGRASGWPHASL